MNQCGWSGTGLAPQPFPDGTGAAGFIIERDIIIGTSYWMEYLGNCLSSPMISGTQYQLTFSIAFAYAGFGSHLDPTCPVDITLFGTTNCADIPWTGSDCPTHGGFVELGHTTYTPVQNSGWGTITISFTPSSNINGIALGGPCAANMPAVGCGYDVDFSQLLSPYFSVDNLILSETSSFDLTVDGELEDGTSAATAGNDFCEDNAVLVAVANASGTFQWYKDGIALAGETSSTLQVSQNSYGTGTYTISLIDGANCISLTYDVVTCILPLSFCYDNNTDLLVSGGNNTFTWSECTATSAGSCTSWSVVDNDYQYTVASPTANEISVTDGTVETFIPAGTNLSSYGVCTLPITLLNFSGKNKSNYNLLNWSTSAEINNDYFTIESSTDGYNFKKIGTTKGSGNSQTLQHYQHRDYDIRASATYYRLKQTDFDGAFKYFKIIAIQSEKVIDVKIYPNPATNNLFFDIDSHQNETYTINYYSVIGNVHQERIQINKGSNIYQAKEFNTLSAGIYFVQILNQKNEIIKQQKIVKK